jgi:pimeloyl-ACP methyl ester carboxylesterase
VDSHAEAFHSRSKKERYNNLKILASAFPNIFKPQRFEIFRIVGVSLFLFFLVGSASFGQSENRLGYFELDQTLQTSTGELSGTLTVPILKGTFPVALIIAGSGPTDRNGNNAQMKNNSLQLLAHELAAQGIASLRYDKRGIGKSASAMISEDQLRFENYVEDAKAWSAQLKTDPRFRKLIVIGHSEGSLIGMLACEQADVFVSLAGAGRSIDVILKEQLAVQLEGKKKLLRAANEGLSKLKDGKLVEDAPVELFGLFRPSVQPYMISWMKYDPAVEISNLKIPIVIIQGSTDLQVKEEDARILFMAHPLNSRLIIIEDMNHVLKIAPLDRTKNIETYSNPELPLAPELIRTLGTL